jgi:hypothetical protein
MNSLDSENELFQKLYDKNIMEDLDKRAEKEEEKEEKEKEEKGEDEEEQIDEDLNNYSLNKCKQIENNLEDLIKNSGPFTLKHALSLEYCRKKGKRGRKKTKKKDITQNE